MNIACETVKIIFVMSPMFLKTQAGAGYTIIGICIRNMPTGSIRCQGTLWAEAPSSLLPHVCGLKAAPTLVTPC